MMQRYDFIIGAIFAFAICIIFFMIIRKIEYLKAMESIKQQEEIVRMWQRIRERMKK
jgi:hypothetical protein